MSLPGLVFLHLGGGGNDSWISVALPSQHAPQKAFAYRSLSLLLWHSWHPYLEPKDQPEANDSMEQSCCTHAMPPSHLLVGLSGRQVPSPLAIANVKGFGSWWWYLHPRICSAMADELYAPIMENRDIIDDVK